MEREGAHRALPSQGWAPADAAENEAAAVAGGRPFSRRTDVLPFPRKDPRSAGIAPAPYALPRGVPALQTPSLRAPVWLLCGVVAGLCAGITAALCLPMP